MSFRNIFFLFFVLYAGSLIAQADGDAISLLDPDDNAPIVGASFQYGAENGLSDAEGVIRFRYVPGRTMTLSHVSYGSWTWTAEDLDQLRRTGVYYRRGTVINLYPATVIAVRPSSRQPGDQVAINYQERLEHDGAAILNQSPAFNSIRKGGNYGFDPVFRGYKYDQLNVVLNGAQSATAACPNRMDPPTSQMAPNMLDRIEVLKGPYALRYGTGFGATINFIPAALRFSSEPGVYGRLSTGYESNGNIARGESRIGFSGAKYDFSLFGAWAQGDDYTSGNGETVPADFSRGSFGANLGLKPAANQQVRVSALYNRARDADFPALPMDLRNDDTWLLNARHDIQLGNQYLQSWNTTLFTSFVDHLMDNRLKPLDPRILNAETVATTYNYGGRTEGVWQFGKNKLFGGADWRVEGAEGIRSRAFLLGPNAGRTVEDNAWQKSRISKTGVFAEYHLTTPALEYVFSGRLELNQADSDDPSAEFTGVYTELRETQLNPSFSVGVVRGKDAAIRTGLWLGRAQRSGGLTERFINYFPVGQDPFEMLGNPQLAPEVNNQVDLTLAWKTAGTALNVDLFASYLQDYISSVIDPALSPRLPMSPGVRQFINIDEAFKTGFEVSWTQQLPLQLQQQFGMAYTYGQDLERDEPLPEIAPLDVRYALTGSYLQDRLRPEVAFRYVVEQSRVSQEFGETVTPSFGLLDVKVGFSVTDQLVLSTGVNNLLDENYYEHLARSVRGTNTPIFAPGRNVFANLSFAF